MAVVTTPQETFLGLEEAAQALQCSADHLAELAAAGRVPAVKVGRAWVFLASQLAAYCLAQQGKGETCVSTNGRGRRAGTPTFGSAAAALDALVAPRTVRKRAAQPSDSTPRPSSSPLNVVLIGPSTRP